MVELVLDTTYLLPVFGVDVGLKKFKTLFPRLLKAYPTLYNPASIVEAKWIVLRLARREPQRREALLRRFREGLRALLSDRRLSQTALTRPIVEEVADMLLVKAGLSDYFDRLIYATAVYRGASLLTEDEELLSTAMRGDLPKPREVISWSDAVKMLSR